MVALDFSSGICWVFVFFFGLLDVGDIGGFLGLRFLWVTNPF